MQISHSSKLRNRAYASPPRVDNTPNSIDPERPDTFQAARHSDKSESNFLGLTLLGLTAVTGFVAGRATVPQAEIKVMESPCECPEVDLQKAPERSTKEDYQNPDDWKEELGGGRTDSGKKSAQKRKSTGSKRTERVNSRESRYVYPDSWKEEIGGSYRYEDSGSSNDSGNSEQNWEGPDDWKSGL